MKPPISKPIGKQRREWVAAGKCKDCGDDPVLAGSKLCPVCRRRRGARQHRLRMARLGVTVR